MSVIKEPKKWYVRLFTLGKNFSSQTFSDNFKKFLLNGIGLFIVVTFTFYVENLGDEYEKRQEYLELSKAILKDLYLTLDYTDKYISENQFVREMFRNQYEKWEIDNDSIFIDFLDDEEEPDGKYYFSPMGFYSNRNPFTVNPNSYNIFKKGTQDFFLINQEISLGINNAYEGIDLKYLIENTNSIENKYVVQFNDIIYNTWTYDLENVDLLNNEFWIKNRKYIQKDKRLKNLLYNRLDLWEEQIAGQLEEYREILTKNIKGLDSVIQVMDNEKFFLYWKIN
jgi:hypothetical protein